MKAKIKHLFTENIGFKLISLVVAVIIWAVVVNVDDPVQTKTFTTSVQIKNEGVLLEQSKYYTLNSNTVTFRVSAKRSILEKLTGSDFTATADMNQLENDSRIPVEITANKYASSITMSTATHYIQVTIGNNTKSKFSITPEFSGETASGYVVADELCTPEIITVSGPSETVSQISSVVARVDLDGAASSFSIEVIPIFLDARGNVVDTTGLEISSETVVVQVNVLATKTVPITVETSGELQAGLAVASITTDPSQITLKGDAATLNSLLSVTIPGSVIDLSEISENTETTVDISAYLPDGVSVADEGNSTVKVSITLGVIVPQDIGTDGEPEE